MLDVIFQVGEELLYGTNIVAVWRDEKNLDACGLQELKELSRLVITGVI